MNVLFTIVIGQTSCVILTVRKFANFLVEQLKIQLNLNVECCFLCFSLATFVCRVFTYSA